MRAAGWPYCCFLVLACGCDSPPPLKPPPSEQSIPWARDESGRFRAWSTCPARVVIRVGHQEPLSPTIRAELRAAFAAWKVPGAPVFVPIFGTYRAPNEDGVSSLSFASAPRCDVANRTRGKGCLDEAWEGLTAIYARVTEKHAETIEVDIRVDRNLIENPRRLREVVVHELGHVLGLDHPSSKFEAKDSVMGSSVPAGSNAPGRLDLERVAAFYKSLCND